MLWVVSESSNISSELTCTEYPVAPSTAFHVQVMDVSVVPETIRPVGDPGASGVGGGGGGIADIPVTWVVQALRSGASSVPPAAATRTNTLVSGGSGEAVNVASALGWIVSVASNISSALTCTA